MSENENPTTTTPQPVQPVRRRRLVPWLIGGGVALIAILATVGIVIGVNHGFDDHDDRQPAAAVQNRQQPSNQTQPLPSTPSQGQTGQAQGQQQGQGHNSHESNGEGHDDGNDDGTAAVTADEQQRASDAALAATGGGTVTLVDRSDDGDHVYSVDVTRTDGTHVDVELAADYSVVTVD